MGIRVSQPHALFDAIIFNFSLKNDSALARALGLTPPVVSKIRSRTRPLCPSVMLKIHDATGWSIKEIKTLIAESA